MNFPGHLDHLQHRKVRKHSFKLVSYLGVVVLCNGKWHLDDEGILSLMGDWTRVRSDRDQAIHVPTDLATNHLRKGLL